MSSCHENLSPSVPDVDLAHSPEEMYAVPGSSNNGTLLSSSELNAPRLGISDISSPVTPGASDLDTTISEIRNVEPSVQQRTPSSNSPSVSSMLSRRGGPLNRHNLHLNLRQRSSPPLPHHNVATPTYSYTAIGHTPTSPPPIAGGSPQPSMFGGQLHHPHPISPGPLVYSYVPSPVSGVPDNLGFFRVIPSGATAHQGIVGRHNTVLFIASGNKRRRESVESETDRIRILESPRGEASPVRVVNS